MTARRPTFALLVQVLALLAAGMLGRAHTHALARRPGRAALTVPRGAPVATRTRLDGALGPDEERAPDRDGATRAKGLPATGGAVRFPARRSAHLAPPQPRVTHRERPLARKPTARGPPTAA